MTQPVHVTVQMATVGTPVEVSVLQVILYSFQNWGTCVRNVYYLVLFFCKVQTMQN